MSSISTQTGSGEKLPLVVAHVFYPDIWKIIADQLATAFDMPFALAVTCRDPSIEVAVPKTPHLKSFERFTTENRGRDILPFLTVLGSTDVDFDIGLKLHTKRSLHRSDGRRWGDFLVGSLLQREDGTGRPIALELMRRERRIGLIAPAHHLLPLEGRMGTNRRQLRKLANALSLSLPENYDKTGHFPAGSMFWFQRDTVACLTNARLPALFQYERGQLDGTMAHAVERLLALLAERSDQVPIAMESVAPIFAEVDSRREPMMLQDLAMIAAMHNDWASNAFITPLPTWIRRYPQLVLFSQYLYGWLPASIWRPIRNGGKWILLRTVRDQPGKRS